jgi:hypothetical protein
MADPTPTERRLLDSIRKAKATPESEPAEASPASEAPKPGRTPANRTRSRPAASGTRVRKTEPKPAAPSNEADAYQAGSRVWPD